MTRAVVHGSTFSKNDLAMAAGLATLQAIEFERSIERSAQLGKRLLLHESKRLRAHRGIPHRVRGTRMAEVVLKPSRIPQEWRSMCT